MMSKSKWKIMAEMLVKQSNEKNSVPHSPPPLVDPSPWCVFDLRSNKKHLMLVNTATKSSSSILLMVPLRKKSRHNYDPHRALLQKIIVKRPQDVDKTLLNTALNLMMPFSSIEELELTFIVQGEVMI